MITTIRSKIGITLALVLAAMSFAPTALADPPQLQLRRHAPEPAQVKEDPFLFRSHDVGGGTTLLNGRAKPDGYQPQLSVTDNPVLLRGYGGTEPRNRGLVDRVGGPDGYQPQLRGVQPAVTIASKDGTDWAAAGSGLAIGMALSAFMVGAWAVGRNRRLAHS
ncbi:MAG TPA: hypothetical protein VE644_02530 [Gaiellaceae bacterium]|nr:hypothetical protein [Gaiellaceae bacterium]